MNLNKLMYHLFFRCKAEYDCLMNMKSNRSGEYSEEEIALQRERFCSVYQVIEEAELEYEYQKWKQENDTGMEVSDRELL